MDCSELTLNSVTDFAANILQSLYNVASSKYKKQPEEEPQEHRSSEEEEEEEEEEDWDRSVIDGIHFKQPSNLGEMFNDILIHIFTFLELDDYYKLLEVNKNFRMNCQHDYLWKRIYKKKVFQYVKVKPDVNKEYCKNFFWLLEESNDVKVRLESIKKTINVTEKRIYNFRNVYGRVFGTILIFSIVFGFFIFPFFIHRGKHDEIFDNTSTLYIWLGLIPQLICVLPSLLVVYLGVCLDANFFTKFLKEKYTLIGTENGIDEKIRVIIQILLYGCLFIPMLNVCWLFRGISGDTLSYSIIFMMLYFTTLILLLFPFFYYKFFLRTFKEDLSPIVIWFILLLINIVVDVQVFLFGLYLDGYISHVAPIFFYLFIPSILLCCCVTVLPLICLTSCGLCSTYSYFHVQPADQKDKEKEKSELFFQISFMCCCITFCLTPIYLFIILFILQMSNLITGAIFLSFIPLWICILLLLCVPCFTSIIKPKDYFSRNTA